MKTKKEMIDIIASNIGSSQKNVREVLEGYKNFVYEEVENGEDVRLMDGLILGIKTIKGRERPNPHTGEMVYSPEHYGLKLRVGTEAKLAVANLNAK